MNHTLYQKLPARNGRRVVAIGGGTGLAALLKGLKNYPARITAIVTVADNGGSSGRLKGEFGVLPPGDLRNCLVALADTEQLMEDLLNYRFQEGAGLAGHNLGNLLLVALCRLTGDFEQAIEELSRVLAVRGKVTPSTLTLVELCAELEDGNIVCGETTISSAATPITRVFLEPAAAPANPAAVEAVLEADLVLLGPGSLYTSVLPNLVIPEIAAALRASRAPVVYILNVMTQKGETTGYKASRHLDALKEHGVKVDYLLGNIGKFSPAVLERYALEGSHPVELDERAVQARGVKVLKANLVQGMEQARHNPDALARFIARNFLARWPWSLRER